jgi:RHS repeat-associated protein
VQAAVPAGSAAAAVRTYLPYGRARQATRHATDRGWIGEVEDRGSGLSYLNARYYDPGMGIFLSPEPVIDEERPKTLNPYAYSLNNPTTSSDPNGLDPPCTHPGVSCSDEALAGQIQALTPSRPYEEVLAHVEQNRADDPPVVTPTDDQAGNIWVESGGNGITLEEAEQAVNITGTTADVAELGLRLCDPDGCALIKKIIPGVGGLADAVGVAIECSDGIDGPCAWAAGLALAENIPVVGEIILAVEILNATPLGQGLADVINTLIEPINPQFGTVLSYDREVMAENGGRPFYENGGQSPWIDANGLPTPPRGTTQGGPGCPLRNPQGVEPLPGC